MFINLLRYYAVMNKHTCECGAIIDFDKQPICDDCQSRKSIYEMEY